MERIPSPLAVLRRAFAAVGRRVPATYPARQLGAIYLVGPTIGALSLVTGSSRAVNFPVVMVIVAGAWAAAAMLLSGAFDPLSQRTTAIVLTAATVLLSAGILFGWPPGSGLTFYYLWTTPIAFVMLSRRQAALHLVVGAAAAAVVLVLQPAVGQSSPSLRLGLGQWINLAATLVVVGGLSRFLVERERASTQRLRIAFAASPIGQTITDEAGRFVEVNRAFAGILARSLGEILGHNLAEFTHPDDLDATTALLRPGAPPSAAVRKRLVRPDGEVRTVTVTYSRHATPAGVQRQAQVIDITETERAREAAEALALAGRRFAREQAALVQLSRHALEEAETRSLLRLACKLVADALGADLTAVVRLSNDGSGREVIAVAGGGATLTEGHRAPFASPEHARKFESPEVIAVAPLPPGVMAGFRPELARLAAGGMASALIKAGPRPFGRLLIGYREAAEFPPDVISFLQSAAAVLGNAIGRARAQRQRRELLKRLLAAQEDERARLARDIHDDTLQVVAAARLEVHRLAAAVSDERARARAADAETALAGSTARLRDLIFQVHPPSISAAGGLEVALRDLAERASGATGIETVVTVEGSLELPYELRVLVYRTVQEALVNVQKHSAAGRAWVRLAAGPATLEVSVRDDGRGFDPSVAPENDHIGLTTAGERIESAGGWLEVRSSPGSGTELRFEVPLEAAA